MIWSVHSAQLAASPVRGCGAHAQHSLAAAFTSQLHRVSVRPHKDDWPWGRETPSAFAFISPLGYLCRSSVVFVRPLTLTLHTSSASSLCATY